MAELCEHCKKLMSRWDATHCSEECLLGDIKNSKSLHNNEEMDRLIHGMRKKNCYDIDILKELR